MHNLDLIATLAGGLTAALVLGYITQRIGLSPIVGYLLAGISIGPYTPGFVADAALAEQLAEIGVILLMFGVGLQFHLDELLAVRRVALPGAVAQSVVATGLGAVAAHWFGWDWPASIVFGVALSVASTVVLIRVLSDNRELHTPTGHIAVGWLVVEDLFTVLILVLLPALLGESASSSSLSLTLGVTALKVSGLIAFTFLIGNRAIPWLLDKVAATHSRELFTLTVLVLALGIAVGSTVMFGVSMALGAFLAGMVVGRSDYSLRAASEALPMRDAFAVLFFVSVGMLLDPHSLLESPGLLAAALAIVLVGKPAVAILVVAILRYPFSVGHSVGVALAQIGEFSFILASLGKDMGILPEAGMNTIVTVSIISIILSPLLFRLSDRVERQVARIPWLWRLLNSESSRAVRAAHEDTYYAPSTYPHRAVVVGYGPTGQILTRLLRSNGIDPTVIELNMETVRNLKAEGIRAVYGDATHPETLKAAGVPVAGSLILTADVASSKEVTRVARELNRDIHVLARTTHLRGLRALKEAGVQSAFSGEGEVALAMTETILQRLGATPEQMDQERERVHAELFGQSAPLRGRSEGYSSVAE
ncbi:MAG: cation:proton antiporter [Candidatus Korobacteraceae bacterium]